MKIGVVYASGHAIIVGVRGENQLHPGSSMTFLTKADLEQAIWVVMRNTILGVSSSTDTIEQALTWESFVNIVWDKVSSEIGQDYHQDTPFSLVSYKETLVMVYHQNGQSKR